MAIKITVDGTTYEGIDAITVGGKVLTLAYVEDSTGGNTGGNTGGGTDLAWEDGVAYSYEIVADEYVDSGNGAFKSESAWSRTPYLYCYGAAELKITGNAYNTNYNAFYDINKNYICNFSISSYEPETIIDVPENAVYFAVSSTTTSMESVQITPYESATSGS